MALMNETMGRCVDANLHVVQTKHWHVSTSQPCLRGSVPVVELTVDGYLVGRRCPH